MGLMPRINVSCWRRGSVLVIGQTNWVVNEFRWIAGALWQQCMVMRDCGGRNQAMCIIRYNHTTTKKAIASGRMLAHGPGGILDVSSTANMRSKYAQADEEPGPVSEEPEPELWGSDPELSLKQWVVSSPETCVRLRSSVQ